MKPVVLAALPNAGLGNKLFVWARAAVFSHLNNIDLMAVGWTYPKVGPLLRGERSWRMYAGHFRQPSTVTRARLALSYLVGPKLFDPPCEKLPAPAAGGVFAFTAIPDWRDLFSDIRDHREFVVSKFRAVLRPRVLADVDAMAPPVVAVHVRRGDFRTLNQGEVFAEVGGVRTPDEYFVEQIDLIRRAAGWNVPITIFSDAPTRELSGILSLPTVSRSAAANDMEDLLLMSRARIIVCSAGSTFSEWSGYLSDALVVRHPEHVHGRIRSAATHGELECPAPRTASGWLELWNAVGKGLVTSTARNEQ